MSTMALIILAVFTAISATLALWLIRWREQQRLQRARASVELIDFINLQHKLADRLNPWLSGESFNWLCRMISQAGMDLAHIGLPINSKVKRVIQQTSDWLESPPYLKAHLPEDEPKAKQLRKSIQQQIELIKACYKKRMIDQQKASRLLNELRLLNVNLVTTVFFSQAKAAISMNNPAKAELQLNKLLKTLRAIRNPNEDQRKLEAEAQTMLQNLAPRPTIAVSKLADAAEQLAEEQESWKKKHF
jgi:hypothetical protein